MAANVIVRTMESHCQIQRNFLRIIFVQAIIAVFGQFVTAESISNLTIDCAQRRLVVTGDTVSIADVISSAKCWSDAKQINIYALTTVIIDNDIDKRAQNVNITIISPTFEIIPFLTKNQTERRIILDAQHEFNFVCICLTKINGDQFQFHVDGVENRTNLYNSGKYSRKKNRIEA